MTSFALGSLPAHQAPGNGPAGGTDKATIAAGTTTPTVVKTGWGRLCRLIVTKVGSADVLVYDGVVADGDVLGAIPGDAPIGTVRDFQTPAVLGICVAGDENLPGLTVTYY